jgi:hypothetical protein
VVEVGSGRTAFGIANCEIREALPEAPLLVGRIAETICVSSKITRGSGPKPETVRQQAFNQGPDSLAKDRRRAVSRDSDDKWRAIDDRPELKIAIRGPIDEIDGHPYRPCGRGKRSGFGLIRERSHGEGRSHKILRRPPALDKKYPATGGRHRQFPKSVREMIGNNVDRSACGGEKLGLPQRGFTTADEDDAFTVKLEENGQICQRADPGRP